MAVFQEGIGGRVITLNDPSQIDSMRANIRAKSHPITGDIVRWIEIQPENEKNYVNPAGFAIQGANSIYGETQGTPAPGTNVAALAADIAGRTDQTYGTAGLPGFGPPAATAISGDQQILDSVMNGTIIDTSQLAQIGDEIIKKQAATQLAKNIVASYSTADPGTLNKWLQEIYNQFITGEGALSFDEWAANARGTGSFDIG